jgi:hypothetical protein
LEKFGEDRINRAQKLGEKVRYEENPDPEQVEEDKKILFEQAKRALLLAEELNPGSILRSLKRHRLIALAEETNGDFGTAYKTISPWIDSSQSTLEQLSSRKDSAQEVSDLRGQLFSSWTVRGRIATKWADKLRGQGNPTDSQEALRLTQEAIADLERGEQYVLTEQGNDPVLRFYVLGIKPLALLTMSEIELSLAQSSKAEAHLQKAQRALDEFVQHAKRTGYDAGEKEAADWAQRIEAGLRRLGVVEVPGEVTWDQAPEG